MPVIHYIALLLLLSVFTHFKAQANTTVEKELAEFWQQAEQTVTQGDFVGYSATFHENAVLVSDIAKTSYPIDKALTRWKKGFDDTKAGKMKAGVSFKFTQSLVSDNTAHQTGYFYYYSIDSQGQKSPFIAHFEALLMKSNGKWQIMMERHIKQVDLQAWRSL
ncbi:hypothetical protein Q4489_17095 [Thalassotalea sp. 1_MG-2023]|uniref:hypothetical protein n=1 Tax=Thalassotalea sp. 1_MG-2023 TaxID=3062680 RepID=UPI0026E326A1|nr:hypothetical protein [Thalassotalea sp. 1_MG-2023]MDO6428728.1 hypothetical protein [Thalassotalea sp. 1_MG-2023]